MNAPESPAAPANRLAGEKSPYLLQHAHNPVDWYPWGEDAFAKARREGKPIFLSVGYSTCHWCHVMAHESFEDPALARLLNRAFVCVKVDREERPDIDRLYMAYVQAVTRGGGGWPMSVWLTPELKPFYGGTYFPPEERYGRPGFPSVLESIDEAWRTSRAKLEAAGDDTLRRLQDFVSAAAAAAPADADTLDRAAAAFLSAYDPRDGGFGGAPKFPRPSVFAFLLRHAARTGSQLPREAVLHTLRRMADGGLHDHLGGGFHRYATDAAWLIPHFEKMLYDQALLACAYLEAWQLSGESLFADVARATLAYVRSDLAGPEGQFYSAEDADSAPPDAPDRMVEGAFYTWTRREVTDALGETEGARFADAFGLGRHDTRLEGRHVLAVSRDGARDVLAQHRDALLRVRAQRPRPHRDDKAITAWNGLMISAFARAYQLSSDPADLDAAQRATAFVRNRLADAATGRLRRSFRGGTASVDGFAEDYACLIQGLLDLYEADFDPRHLEWALGLQTLQDDLFWDPAGGGYFSSAEGAADVLIRIKEMHDGAEPSAGAVSALNLLRLAAVTGSESHRSRAEALFGCFDARLREQPESVPQMLAARTVSLRPFQQIVIAGRPGAADTRALLLAVRQEACFNRIVLLADGGAGQLFLARLQPSVGEMRPQGGRAAAYVCQDFACRAPVTDPEALRAWLREQR